MLVLTVLKIQIHAHKPIYFRMRQLLIDFRRQRQTISHAPETMDRIQIEEFLLDIPFVRDVL